MRLYRGHFTEGFTYSLLAPNMAVARARLKGKGAYEKLLLNKIEDLGEPPSPPPENESPEEKLLAALFGTYQSDYDMPEDFMKFSKQGK